MATNSLVSVEHLHRYYGNHCAVNGVSFTLTKGEVLGFLGPNGAGKSTTMQIISGNLAPSAGRVTIDGIDLLDDPIAAKAQLGFLPEQPPIYRELSVDEYLDYAAALNRIPKAQRREARDSAKERCGLTEVGRRLIGNLSKGYQQRVGIAQAIIHMPALVILDEPTVGLDPIQIREIRALIRELGRDHGVILSTHILPEVQATCDRVQIINQGALVYSDTSEALARRVESEQYLLPLRQPAPQAALTAIAGVEGVEALDEYRFRIRLNENSDGDRLLSTCIEQGWGVEEFTVEKQNLEQIFVELTTTDTSHKEEAA